MGHTCPQQYDRFVFWNFDVCRRNGWLSSIEAENEATQDYNECVHFGNSAIVSTSIGEIYALPRLRGAIEKGGNS